MKQTAVEWYNLKVIELMTQREQENIDVLEFRNQLDLLLTQAKEMEKQQIVEAHGNKLKKSKDEGNYEYWFSGEDYYNKTYKNTKQ
jgi:hypothetical protein